MKKLILPFAFALFFLNSCNDGKQSEIENRLIAIEKSLAIKDSQITGLSELAYYNALDTAALENDSFNIALITFAAFQIPNPASCKAACLNKLKRHLNICRHVPPANRIWCETTACNNYRTCIARCH
ncbi:MAG: hypothetical protein IPL42_05390 [Saprospiraceae bacterium]|nr:hypothetical protein [Saprospiraceae bacterium]